MNINLKVSILCMMIGLSLASSSRAMKRQIESKGYYKPAIARRAGTIQDHFNRAKYTPNQCNKEASDYSKNENEASCSPPKAKKSVHFASKDQLETKPKYIRPKYPQSFFFRPLYLDGYKIDSDLLNQKERKTAQFDQSVLQVQPKEKNSIYQATGAIIDPVIKAYQSVATAQTHWQRVSGLWQKCPTLVKASAVIGTAAAVTWTGYQLYKKLIRK